MTGSWEGAIVRGQGQRKGRVIAEGQSRFTMEYRLLVHWEDGTLEDVPRARMTMLKPPLGFSADGPLRDGGPVDRIMRSRWLIVAAILTSAALTIATGLVVFHALTAR